MEKITKNSRFPLGGFNLIEVSSEVWQLQIVDDDNFLGSFLEILLIATLKYNISLREIETAIVNMIENNHNSAHFGMWGTFIFSFNKQFDQERKAS